MKPLLFLFVSSVCWGSLQKPLKPLISSKDEIQRQKCHQMFRENPAFNQWYEASLKEKEAFENLSEVQERLQKSFQAFQQAKRQREKAEEEFKESISKTQSFKERVFDWFR